MCDIFFNYKIIIYFKLVGKVRLLYFFCTYFFFINYGVFLVFGKKKKKSFKILIEFKIYYEINI